MLLFTPFTATRFAMHRIYANRINSRGMSRVFCDLRSQKTPRGILPVNSNTSGRMRQKMAKILCVCISKERKTCSQNIHECEADLQGLVGDVHYGMGGRKQVSLLPYEKVKEYFEQSEEEFRYGRFGENLLVEGINWNSIAEGNRFRCGDVLLEAVRIGAGGPASDAYKGEKVCTPMEPWFVFCQILEAGRLREGEIILQQR